jgi:hypothetical protein
MKAIAATLLILTSVLTIHSQMVHRVLTDPGVDAQHWILVSDKMGFVVTPPQSVPGALVTTDRQPLLLSPPTEGYFMIRNRNGWHRIIIQHPLKGPGSSG